MFSTGLQSHHEARSHNHNAPLQCAPRICRAVLLLVPAPMRRCPSPPVPAALIVKDPPVPTPGVCYSGAPTEDMCTEHVAGHCFRDGC
ncbi:hypothetical protein PsYK624_153300 [Phanerochaete sordida]|uniref:Uncharacterized protein n=1 Tax=Phanerochaete sordida TaxID=48140 RepID=A0A9P3LM81_9APHY|nr:hypothetical protein PsYK624_153300 [Phanerochaete sordida]